MKLKFQRRLNASTTLVWDKLLSPETLDFVASPMVVFNYQSEKPVKWIEGNYIVELKLFGFIPFGTQTISISFPNSNSNTLYLRDNGYSNLITKWDHLISLESLGEHTLYTDNLEVRAGILTPIIWIFGLLFYSHRQRRWVKLINQLSK